MQQINKLRNLIKNIFIKKGLNLRHSKLCANALINAELVGAPLMDYPDLKCIVIELKKNLLIINQKLKSKNFFFYFSY